MNLLLPLLIILVLILLVLDTWRTRSNTEDEVSFHSSARVAQEEHLHNLLRVVREGNGTEAAQATNQILSIGPRAISWLVQQLSHELFLNCRPQHLKVLRTLLIDFGLPVLPELLQLLHTEGDDPVVSSTVLQMIREMGPSTLHELLDPRHHKLLPKTQKLIFAWTPQALELCVQALTSQPQLPYWPELFRHWLNTSSETHVTTALQQCTHNASNPLQHTLLHILTLKPHTLFQPFFIEILNTPPQSSQIMAIHALAKLGDPSLLETHWSTDPLREEKVLALQQDSYTTRRASLLALLESQKQDALQHQDWDWAILCEQCRVYWDVHIDLPALQTCFEHVLQDSQSSTSLIRILELISTLSDEDQQPFLEKSLLHPHPTVAYKAIQQLEQQASVESTKLLYITLQQRIQEKNIARKIQKALAQHLPNALPFLQEQSYKAEPLILQETLKVLLQATPPLPLHTLLSLFQDDRITHKLQDKHWKRIQRHLHRRLEQPDQQQAYDDFFHRFPQSPLKQKLREKPPVTGLHI
ncbi:MAG: hypothetical protein AAGJ35_02975 [Myxococcota bacterium]